MKVYQYVIFYNPPKDSQDKAKVLSNGVVTEVASDERAVMMKASRSIPDDYLDKLEHVEIAVRPF